MTKIFVCVIITIDFNNLKTGGKKMYCNHCGKLIDDNSAFCTYCGKQIENTQNAQNVENKDNFDVVFSILSFLIPLAGLILFLCYENSNPKRAKAAGKWALIGVIAKIALSVISAILGVIFSFAVGGSLLGFLFG